MIRHIVLAKQNAQLGNRLTMHAHLLACCLEKGCTFINPTLGKYGDFFVGTRGRLFIQSDAQGTRKPVPEWQHKMAYRCTRMLYQITKVSRIVPWFPVQSAKATRNPSGKGMWEFLEHLEQRGGRIAFVSTWNIRNYALCLKHAEVIRTTFKPLPEIRRDVEKRMKSLRSRTDLILGVHIRHGDYRKHKNGELFFLPKDYRRWMEEFARSFPGKKVGFAICSDAKQHEEDFLGLEFIFGAGNERADDYGNRRYAAIEQAVIEDNYLLSRCDYILGTVSTFCSWAAYWGNKPLLQVQTGQDHVYPDQFVVLSGPD